MLLTSHTLYRKDHVQLVLMSNSPKGRDTLLLLTVQFILLLYIIYLINYKMPLWIDHISYCRLYLVYFSCTKILGLRFIYVYTESVVANSLYTWIERPGPVVTTPVREVYARLVTSLLGLAD